MYFHFLTRSTSHIHPCPRGRNLGKIIYSSFFYSSPTSHQLPSCMVSIPKHLWNVSTIFWCCCPDEATIYSYLEYNSLITGYLTFSHILCQCIPHKWARVTFLNGKYYSVLKFTDNFNLSYIFSCLFSWFCLKPYHHSHWLLRRRLDYSSRCLDTCFSGRILTHGTFLWPFNKRMYNLGPWGSFLLLSWFPVPCPLAMVYLSPCLQVMESLCYISVVFYYVIKVIVVVNLYNSLCPHLYSSIGGGFSFTDSFLPIWG